MKRNILCELTVIKKNPSQLIIFATVSALSIITDENPLSVVCSVAPYYFLSHDSALS